MTLTLTLEGQLSTVQGTGTYCTLLVWRMTKKGRIELSAPPFGIICIGATPIRHRRKILLFPVDLSVAPPRLFPLVLQQVLYQFSQKPNQPRIVPHVDTS